MKTTPRRISAGMELSDIKPDLRFPEFEKHRGKYGSKPYIVPIDFDVRQPFKHHRKEDSDNGKGNNNADKVQYPFMDVGGSIFSGSGKCGGDEQRDQ
jgi:hypothetical protein